MTGPAKTQNGTSARPRYVVMLTVAAALILVVGILFRPRAEDVNSMLQMPEGEVTRLQAAAQRRSLEDDTYYFRSLSTDVGQAVAFLPDRGATGVAWGMGRMVTTGSVPDRLAPGASGALPDVARPRSRPVALTDGPAPDVVAPARVEGAISAGDWVLAVWEDGTQRAFVPGRFVGTATVTCAGPAAREALTTLPLFPAMAGGGLFDLYGNLVGVIVPCGPRMVVLGAASVDAILAEAASVRGRVLDRYGLEATALTPQEMEHFGVTAGAMVRAVWVGEPSDLAGVMPGDVIVAIDAKPVTTVEELSPLAVDPTEPVLAVTVSRAGKPVELPFGTVPGAEAAAPTVTRDYLIETVPPGSVAEGAGLRPGDRLLRLEQRAIRTTAEVTRLLAGSQATTFVEVERAGRRWGLFLP